MTDDDALTQSLMSAMRHVDKLACQVAAAEVEIRKLRMAFSELSRGEVAAPPKFAQLQNIDSLTRYTCTEQKGDYTVTVPDLSDCEQ